MIATRQRKKPSPFKKLALPGMALLTLILALTWPPSHRIIFEGPLAPLWRAGNEKIQQAKRPFDAMEQARTIAQLNKDVQKLNGRLAADHDEIAKRDKRISTLQSQISQLQQQAASPTARPNTGLARPAVAGAGALAVAGVPAVQTVGATPNDSKRIAGYWSAMDPEAAAAVAAKLPTDTVVRVFTAMTPAQVAEILNAMPPATAAKILAAKPDLGR